MICSPLEFLAYALSINHHGTETPVNLGPPRKPPSDGESIEAFGGKKAGTVLTRDYGDTSSFIGQYVADNAPATAVAFSNGFMPKSKGTHVKSQSEPERDNPANLNGSTVDGQKYQNPQRSDPLRKGCEWNFSGFFRILFSIVFFQPFSFPDIGFPGHVTATATLPRGGYVISEERLPKPPQRTPPPPNVQKVLNRFVFVNTIICFYRYLFFKFL